MKYLFKPYPVVGHAGVSVVLCCLVIVLALAAQPVERTWCRTDVVLAYVIPFVAVVGGLGMMLGNRRFVVSRLDMVLFAWFLYAMGRAYFLGESSGSVDCDASYPCATFCLRSMQMLMLYGAFRLVFSVQSLKEGHVVVPILVFALWEAWLGCSQFVHGNSRHHLYLLTGSFLNPGPYSAILAIGLVMALCWKNSIGDCAVREKKIVWKHRLFTLHFSEIHLIYIPIIIFTIVLPATWSRAALFATAVCIGIIYWESWKRWRWWVTALGLFSGLCLYCLKAGSANGRLIIWLISLLSCMHHPVFGSGIGSFFHQYAEEMASFSQEHPDFNFLSADVLDYAFNDLLRIAVEQGIIGLGCAIAVIVFTFRSLERKGRILRMGLLAILVFSLFSYPFEMLPYQIIVTLILAYAGTNEMIDDATKEKRQFLHRCFVPTICLWMVIMPFTLFVARQVQRRSKAESEYRMMAGLSDAAFISDYYELLPLLTENPRFLFDFGKMLTKQGRYNDSNAMLRQGALVSNDPMFYVVQGNNYRDMGAYEEAETAYQKAFHVLPNRIYPLYQLMLLYEQTGKQEKMWQMAQHVIDFKVKVESPATQEMKEKAFRLYAQGHPVGATEQRVDNGKGKAGENE